MILFLVHPKDTNIRFITWALDREQAKRHAVVWLGFGWGGPDNWEVTPLSAEGDRVHMNVTLNA